MNHSIPVDGVSVNSVDGVFDRAKPGTFFIYADGRHIYCECPCGCGSHMRLAIHPTNEQPTSHPSWSWCGSYAVPTLKPSIRDMAGCRFHGHLTDGVWTFESDSGVL